MAALSTPINTTKVANTIQSSSRNVGVLCTASTINKWSKHKPIRYPKVDGLLENEWRGTTADILQNIIYGLKVGTGGMNWKDLHNTNYDYVGRPTGGANAPYRLGDFRGYDHDARPSLYGFPGNDEYYYWDAEGSLSITIINDWNGTNTTGINLSDLTDLNDAYDIADYYPCVMIGTWVHACYNKTLMSLEKTYTPLKYNEVQYSNFAVDIDEPELQVEQMQTVSFFLIRQIQDTLIDLRNWVNIADLAENRSIIGIPECIGLQLESRRYEKIYIPVCDTFRASQTAGVVITWGWQDLIPETAQDISIAISTDGGNYFGGFKSITWAPDSSINQYTIYITWEEMGIIPLPDQTFESVHVRMTTESGSHTSIFSNVTVE